MDVDTLRIGQSPGLAETLIANSNERRNRTAERAEQAAAQQSELSRQITRNERQDVTVRSSRVRAAVLHRRRSGSSGMPEITSSNKMQVEFDREAEQFRMVKRTIENANRRMIGGNSMFQYAIHERTNQIMVKVIDRETKELLLEIPPERALDAIAKMWELAGIFVDERR
jgi:flagellar protein FlaG